MLKKINPLGAQRLGLSLLEQCLKEARLKPRRRIYKTKRIKFNGSDSEKEKRFMNSKGFSYLCDMLDINEERLKQKFYKIKI